MVNLKIFKNWNRRDLFKTLFKNIFLIIGIAFLFYGSVFAAIPGLILLIPMMKKDREKSEKKKKMRFALEFREALRSMRTAMHSGYSIENAMIEAIDDLVSIYGSQAMIVSEFRYMENQLHIQIPVEKIWHECAIRTDVEEVRNFSDVFQIAKRTGGDMISIMDHACRTISEKLEVSNELETVMASKKMEWKIMTLIPFFIILYMKISFPEFMNEMYGNLTGILVMTGALLLMAIAFFIGEKITDIEV